MTEQERQPEDVYDLFRRGEALIASRHHAQAAIVLRRAARVEPGKGSIVEALGRALYNSGQWADAEGAFRTLIDIDPSSHYGHFGLAHSLRKQRRIDEARTHLRLAVALSPSSSLYRDALGRLPPATPPATGPASTPEVRPRPTP